MYLVIAKRWNEQKGRQETYVVGTFEEFANANLCKKAYVAKYSAQARIIEDNEL